MNEQMIWDLNGGFSSPAAGARIRRAAGTIQSDTDGIGGTPPMCRASARHLLSEPRPKRAPRLISRPSAMKTIGRARPPASQRFVRATVTLFTTSVARADSEPRPEGPWAQFSTLGAGFALNEKTAQFGIGWEQRKLVQAEATVTLDARRQCPRPRASRWATERCGRRRIGASAPISALRHFRRAQQTLSQGPLGN